jgi:serine/threonine protein kinase/sugar lactone lactonase YvrE
MVGATLNHYRITRALGAGGMGEVFLAEDQRLKRAVAIKILPAEFAADPSRRERFEREAQAIAALNHPNIVTVHSVEQSGDLHFMTMEYVEGRTLGEFIAKGGMPLGRLLGTAAQIVDAMIAAHGRGIVHRDLKPANVMVGPHDRVKVLDFGLAKLREGTDDIAATQATRELTGEGKIVGTVAYMSPEQAEGKPVDERSDIFSFGVILYELATGLRPFAGDTNVSVLSSILRDTPKSVIEVNPALPRDLARIVRHCLAKEPDRRYQSAKDLRNDLDDVAQALASGELDMPHIAPVTRSRRPLVAVAVVLAIAAASALAAWRIWGSDNGDRVAPALTFSQFTHQEGFEQNASVSPDGRWVIYASAGDIHLQSVSGQTAINLTKDSPVADFQPAFSPDGERIVFRSNRDGGGLFVMGRTGESVRRLTKGGFEPAWFPDGQRIVYSTREGQGPENRINFSDLWAVTVAGGEPQKLFAGDAVQPKVSPNGKRIAYWALPSDASTNRLTAGGMMANREVWTIDVNGNAPVRVTTHDANDWNPVWAPDGRWLYFLSNRSGSMNLWRVAIDEDSGEVRDEPQPLTAPAAYVSDFALSGDGSVAAFTSVLATRNIARVPINAATGKTTGDVESVTSGTGDYAYIDVSRDGRQVVASSSERGQEDIFVIPVGSGGLRQLTNDFARDRAPRWAPDGRTLFFYSDRTGYQIWRVDADGSGLRQVTSDSSFNIQYPVLSPDGTRVIAANTIGRALMIFDANDFARPLEHLPEVPDPTVTSPRATDWSPNGDRLLIAGLGGRGGMWVYSLSKKTYTPAMPGLPAGTNASFLDDQRLLMVRGGALVVVDVQSGAVNELLRIPGEVVNYPRVSGDRSYVYFTRARSSADLWLMRFAPPTN